MRRHPALRHAATALALSWALIACKPGRSTSPHAVNMPSYGTQLAFGVFIVAAIALIALAASSDAPGSEQPAPPN